MSRIFDSSGFLNQFQSQSQSNVVNNSNNTMNMSMSQDPEPTLHKLSYDWTFWQHLRMSSKEEEEEKEEKEGNDDEEKDDELDDNEIVNNENENINDDDTSVNLTASDIDKRDAQYLQDTTILKFPKVNLSRNNKDNEKEGEEEETEIVDSIEQFWVSFSNLKNIEDVSIDTEYFFFKNGIKPLWEDEMNKNGGRWSFSFSNSHHKFKRLALSIFWELLLLKLVSGKFIDDEISLPLSKEALDNSDFEDIECNKTMSNKDLNKLIMDDIAGIVISVRNKKIIISIWNTHLSYENFKRENNVTSSIKNEEYTYKFREKIKFKSKQIYRDIGLTTYQFRQLIFDSVYKILNESFEYVKKLENVKDSGKLYNKQVFKYSPHFNEGVIDSKKGKFTGNAGGSSITNGSSAFSKGNKKSNVGLINNNNSEWYSNKNNKNITTPEGERYNTLGKIRKKVEFNEDGLVVEEINVSSLRQKWGRKRRPLY